MATQAQQQSFIQAATPYALAVAQQTGIDPRVVIAQAALESNWGTAAPQNNYFGIKGSGASLPTSEFINGREVPISANFAAYPDMAGSFQGYGNLMNTNYYAPVRNAQGLDAQIAALGRSGYATEPDYAAQVGAIAHSLPDLSGTTGPQFANANDVPPLPTLPPQSPFTMPGTASPFFGGAPLAPTYQLASYTGTSPNNLLTPLPWGGLPAGVDPSRLASTMPYSPPSGIDPSTLATPISASGSDTLTDPFQKPSTVNYLGSAGGPSGAFTPAEANNIPAGPYGADALVRAALTGDPTAIQNAENSIMSAALQQEGVFGISKAQSNLQDYLNTLSQQDPGTIRQVQSILATNPNLQSLIPPQLQPSLQSAFNALPPTPTAQIPLPNLAPPFTGVTIAPYTGNQSPQQLLTSFDTSTSALPPGGLPPQGDSLGGSGMLWQPGMNTPIEMPRLPPADQQAQPQVGTYLPPGSPTIPDFSQFNNPLPQLGSTTPDWSSTPYGANPDYGSVASTIGNAIGGGLSSLFGGSADASTAGGADTGPSYLGPPIPLGNAAAAPSSFNAPSAGTIPSLYGGFATPTYNVQQSFSPATQAILASQKPISFAPQPQFAALAANPLNSFAFNSFAGKLPTSFPGFGGGTATVAAAPKPTWIPRPAAATAPPPPPVNYTDPTTGQLLTPSQQAFADQYGAPLQNVNWGATLAPDPYSQAAPGTYVLNDLGSNGFGGASGSDYINSSGNGF